MMWIFIAVAVLIVGLVSAKELRLQSQRAEKALELFRPLASRFHGRTEKSLMKGTVLRLPLPNGEATVGYRGMTYTGYSNSNQRTPSLVFDAETSDLSRVPLFWIMKKAWNLRWFHVAGMQKMTTHHQPFDDQFIFFIEKGNANSANLVNSDLIDRVVQTAQTTERLEFKKIFATHLRLYHVQSTPPGEKDIEKFILDGLALYELLTKKICS